MPTVFRSSFSALLFLLASVSLAQPLAERLPYRVGDDVMRPEKISGSPPLYTAEARQAKVIGVVILQAVIDEQGNVTDVEVLKGLPAGLDQSAVKAVETWKFRPATLHGKPVPVYYTLTVNFTLETGLFYGPVLTQFMKENPDFGEHMRAQRYRQALDLLEGRDASPETRLARIYALSAMHRIDEAWAEAQAYDGADPYEVFNQVAFAALNAGARGDEQVRAGFLEIGLQAADEALAARADDRNVTITKSLLLREKAELATDPQRAALIHEAGELEKKAGISP